MADFSIKKSSDLDDETHFILDLVKGNNNLKMGDLFKVYQEKGGKSSYKTFQRKISKLDQGKFITLEKKKGGEGNTSIVKYSRLKKLDEF